MVEMKFYHNFEEFCNLAVDDTGEFRFFTWAQGPTDIRLYKKEGFLYNFFVKFPTDEEATAFTDACECKQTERKKRERLKKILNAFYENFPNSPMGITEYQI